MPHLHHLQKFPFRFSKPPRKIMVVAIVLLLLIISASLLLLYSPITNIPTNYSVSDAKTWKITVLYDYTRQSLSLTNISLLNKTFRPDYRDTKFSAYTLTLVDKQNSVIYQVPIHITELIIPDVILPVKITAADIPKLFKTTFYIPHFPQASALFISKRGRPLITVPLSNSLSHQFLLPHVDSAFAQISSSSSCQPLQVVFISENYNGNFDKFHKDLEKIKSIIKSTPPYSEKPSMFDYKVVDNTLSLGCTPTTLIDCIQNPQISDIALSKYPNAGKVIVVFNNENPVLDGKTGFGVAGLGGNISVVSAVNGKITTEVGEIDPTQMNVLHEFLGHSLGLLWDRYIYVANLQLVPALENQMKTQGPKSNCTDNQDGERFWKQAGSNKPYPGCTTKEFFAPSERTCQDPNNGTHDSIMSVGGCGKFQFDSVEQAWIRQNILPLYSGCQNQTSPTTSASPTSKEPSSSPSGPIKVPPAPTLAPCQTETSTTLSPQPTFVKLGGIAPTASPNSSGSIPCPTPTSSLKIGNGPNTIPTNFPNVPSLAPGAPSSIDHGVLDPNHPSCGASQSGCTTYCCTLNSGAPSISMDTCGPSYFGPGFVPIDPATCQSFPGLLKQAPAGYSCNASCPDTCNNTCWASFVDNSSSNTSNNTSGSNQFPNSNSPGGFGGEGIACESAGLDRNACSAIPGCNFNSKVGGCCTNCAPESNNEGDFSRSESNAAVKDCHELDNNADKCVLTPGCAYFACSTQCFPAGTPLKSACPGLQQSQASIPPNQSSSAPPPQSNIQPTSSQPNPFRPFDNISNYIWNRHIFGKQTVDAKNDSYCHQFDNNNDLCQSRNCYDYHSSCIAKIASNCHLLGGENEKLCSVYADICAWDAEQGCIGKNVNVVQTIANAIITFFKNLFK